MSPRARTMLRRGALALVAILVVIQVVPAERTNPPVTAEVAAPPDVQAILERSCYDCHSHETRWPWYSRVAPVSWWVTGHVEEAREHLNFSAWPADPGKLDHLLHEIDEEVGDGTMPLRSYTLLHRGARLDEAAREAVLRWARESDRGVSEREATRGRPIPDPEPGDGSRG